MKSTMGACGLAATGLLILSTMSYSQEQAEDTSKKPTSNQLLMRDKLLQMNRVLEGITLGDFEQVQQSGETLGMISQATSWHVADPTPQYQRMSQNFQEQAEDLQRHAKARNVEAATLDLVRMNITCTQCHQHMRDEADRGK
jgi:Tfp pilus assembly protein FimV